MMLFRLYKNGLLKTLPVFAELNYMDMMPLKVGCKLQFIFPLKPLLCHGFLHTFTLF